MTTTTAQQLRPVASLVAADLAAVGITRGIMASHSPDRPNVARVAVLPGAAPSNLAGRIADTLTAAGWIVTRPAGRPYQIEAQHPADVAAPVYVLAHGGHPADSEEFGPVGYDVVRTSWSDAGPVVVEVTAVVHGAHRYAEALAAAKAHRTGRQAWGYTATRYACGCRWIAQNLDAVGANPAPEFVDHPDA